MGRKPWTTKKEREWLSDRIPAFQQAQTEDSTKEFFEKVIGEWYDLFPLPPPTEAGISKAGGEAQAILVLKEKQDAVSFL